MTFAAALRSILRHDPDVILIGEIRDGETANSAIQASLTGHMVFSTLHTNDASGAFTRLDIRFRGQFCYVDAYREPELRPDWPPPDWRESREEYAERLRNTPTHLCRLRYFGPDTNPQAPNADGLGAAPEPAGETARR